MSCEYFACFVVFGQSRQSKLSFLPIVQKEHWHQLEFEEIDLDCLSSESVPRSRPADIVLHLLHPGLTESHVRVQAVLTRKVGNFQSPERMVIDAMFTHTEKDGRSAWRLRLDNAEAGDYSLAFRAMAQRYGEFEDTGFELRLVKWM